MSASASSLKQSKSTNFIPRGVQVQKVEARVEWEYTEECQAQLKARVEAARARAQAQEIARANKDSVSKKDQPQIQQSHQSTIPTDNINICVVGGVSTGKSTFLNAIFCEQLTECKIKRTIKYFSSSIQCISILYNSFMYLSISSYNLSFCNCF